MNRPTHTFLLLVAIIATFATIGNAADYYVNVYTPGPTSLVWRPTTDTVWRPTTAHYPTAFAFDFTAAEGEFDLWMQHQNVYTTHTLGTAMILAGQGHGDIWLTNDGLGTYHEAGDIGYTADLVPHAIPEPATLLLAALAVLPLLRRRS